MLFFADHITATLGADLGRMNGARRDVEPLARSIAPVFSLGGNGDAAFEHYMCGNPAMGMIGVEGVRAIPVDKYSGKALGLKFFFEFLFLHD